MLCKILFTIRILNLLYIFVTVITIPCKTIRKKNKDNKKQVLQKALEFFYNLRWKNWRGLFTACHFFVSLIYILAVVAKLRFLGWKFWKLIGSALAPPTAGWATNRILRIIHGINRKVLLGVTRVTKLWYVMMLIKPCLINRKDGLSLILIVSDTLIRIYFWVGTHGQSGVGKNTYFCEISVKKVYQICVNILWRNWSGTRVCKTLVQKV